MSFWDRIRGEFVDVIEWTDDSQDTLVHRFERYGNEIKYGAMLTVREGQVAVLVNEGRLADVYQPGLYKLETSNMPIMTTIMSWPHGFQSPFKAEVYFFSTRQFTDLKWGTKNPIMLRDREFGPVRLRAYGTYTIRIENPAVFLREVVGTDGRFTTDEITNQLRNLIVSRFSTILGDSGIPVLDLAANYDKLGDFISKWIGQEFGEYGLALPTLLVENISLPDAVEKALDKRTSMGIIGNLEDYATFQAAEAMTVAAANPGGGAGDGVGLGMGFAMASKLGETLSTGGKSPAAAPGAAAGGDTPPPLPTEARYYLAVNGHQTGPFTKAEVRAKIQSGELSRDSLAWRPGLEEWQEAEGVVELAQMFAQMPPPLPPQ
ncbi:MAG: SPFH domain-containing protein [Pseudomonadota bacterium]